MASTSSEQNNIAQKTWEMSNNIEMISTVDEIYRYDRKEQQDILAAKPWEKEYIFLYLQINIFFLLLFITFLNIFMNFIALTFLKT